MYYTAEQLDLWTRILATIKEDMNPALFRSTIEPMQLYAVTNNEVIVTFKDFFAVQMIGSRYRTNVERLVQANFGPDYNLIVVDETQIDTIKLASNRTLEQTSVNPKYTFDNFIVGSSNNFAFAASAAVAEEPSKAYNPLFIYGDVGLGKTHLMNAIGNAILDADPSAKVAIMSSEYFANEVITAIGNRTQADLRDRMRTVDVLMVDDIQFFAKKTATQEEFFHTFNDLHSKDKQIIISSDRPPKELPYIEERLRSRFEWGLIVDIQKPDFETRVAILRRKAEEEAVEVPYDVIEYIAAHFDSSIRELEGALNRLQAQSRLLKLPINLTMAETVLSSIANTRDTRDVNADSVMQTVARRYDVEVADLLSKKRNREIAVPRQIAMYICRELTAMSTTNIGRAFGNRDHTTVMHSCEKVAEQMRSDLAFKKRVEELMDLVKNG